MAATGESTFTTAGRTAKRFESTPVPAGQYDGKLDASKLEIGRKPEAGKMPYIKGVRFELLGTAAEGGRNRSIYNLMFTSITPGKGGFVLVDKANQIVGLAKALGEDFTAPVKSMEDGVGGTVQYLDPRAIVEWLKAHDDSIVPMQVKIRREKDRPAQNEIDYFLEAENAGAFDSDTGEVLEDDAADPMAADEPEVDDLPPPPAKKPAAKPVQKPAPHVVASKRPNGAKPQQRR